VSVMSCLGGRAPTTEPFHLSLYTAPLAAAHMCAMNSVRGWSSPIEACACSEHHQLQRQVEIPGPAITVHVDMHERCSCVSV
jgi:hypothetical protein